MAKEIFKEEKAGTRPPENKMGTQPVGKLLITMSLPIIAAMLVQALYNIVDSIFVSQINENALSAVSIAFPIQNIIMALAIGCGTGANALISRSLGAKDTKTANRVTQNAIFLAGIVYLILLLFSIFFAKPFISAMVGDADRQIYEYGVTYLDIICKFGFGASFTLTFERLLNATGKTHLSPVSQGVGALVNIILDPVLIFGLGPFPELGVAGAAIATVTAQITGAAISLTLNITRNKEISLNMKGFRPHGRTIYDICRIGIPSALIIMLNSLTTVILNILLIGLTETAVAVLGVYHKLSTFVFMPMFGVNQALVPLYAYNLGARKKKRMIQSIRSALKIGISLMLIGTVLFFTIPGPLLSMFNASESMMTIGITALREIAPMFPIVAICVILSSVMQASGYAMYSALGALCRQIIALVPAAYLLSWIGGLNAVWWAFLIAEVVSLIIIAALYSKVKKAVIDTIED